MSPAMDAKIITHVLHSFRDRLVSKSQLEAVFKNVLHEMYDDSIVHNLRRKKDIIYVFKGYYYIVSPSEKIGSYHTYSVNEMVYAVLNKLNINWYLGLDSALEKNNIIWQSIARPIILNDEISGKRTILGVPYEFRKIKKQFLSFGFKKNRTKNRITYYYSDPEKTYIDYHYLNIPTPSDLTEIKNNAKTVSYLQKYSKSFKKKVLYS